MLRAVQLSLVQTGCGTHTAAADSGRHALIVRELESLMSYGRVLSSFMRGHCRDRRRLMFVTEA